MKKLFLIVAIISLAATPTWAALIENGGFEKSIYPDTPTWDFKQLNYESTDITGWIVGLVNLDYIHTYWQPAEGSKSIDLNGNTWGSISQPLGTVDDTAYRVTFAMSGNFTNADPTGTDILRHLRVTAGGSTQDFVFTKPQGWSATNMGWTDYVFNFEADGPALLTFTSLESSTSACGPAVDNVRVSQVNAVPIPGAAWLLGSGLVGLAVTRRRFKK
jgi:choice-of-anchor C domain-containing protein